MLEQDAPKSYETIVDDYVSRFGTGYQDRSYKGNRTQIDSVTRAYVDGQAYFEISYPRTDAAAEMKMHDALERELGTQVSEPAHNDSKTRGSMLVKINRGKDDTLTMSEFSDVAQSRGFIQSDTWDFIQTQEEVRGGLAHSVRLVAEQVLPHAIFPPSPKLGINMSRPAHEQDTAARAVVGQLQQVLNSNAEEVAALLEGKPLNGTETKIEMVKAAAEAMTDLSRDVWEERYRIPDPAFGTHATAKFVALTDAVEMPGFQPLNDGVKALEPKERTQD